MNSDKSHRKDIILMSNCIGGDIMGNYYQPFSLRVSEELIEKIKVIAKNHKRSANKEMELILEDYVKDYENEHGEIDIEE